MTSYKNPLMYGSGVIDSVISVISAFTWEKYPIERHYPYYNYLGPHTRSDIRLDDQMQPKQNEQPVVRVWGFQLRPVNEQIHNFQALGRWLYER